MTSNPLTEVTGLLQAWSRGDRNAEQKLWPILYAELKRLAQREMHRERLSHTLQSGALVNELYMRLAGWEGAQWQNRAHFFGMCARIMRQILVDHARSRCVQKRGGPIQRIALREAAFATDFKDSELLAVDEALSRFADQYPRQTKVVELRFFGGLSVEETAAALNVSHPTVIRDWKFARAWLKSSLEGEK
jgi:RNA polymerase sigma factor (TIGR02999 family)